MPRVGRLLLLFGLAVTGACASGAEPPPQTPASGPQPRLEQGPATARRTSIRPSRPSRSCSRPSSTLRFRAPPFPRPASATWAAPVRRHRPATTRATTSRWRRPAGRRPGCASIRSRSRASFTTCTTSATSTAFVFSAASASASWRRATPPSSTWASASSGPTAPWSRPTRRRARPPSLGSSRSVSRRTETTGWSSRSTAPGSAVYLGVWGRPDVRLAKGERPSLPAP